MNLSCHKMMGSGAGDTLTITCFTCGMPSSKEWAQKISSRPTIPPRPFYPFLVTVQPPAGAVLKEDGTTFVCAFCHASLEAQWRNYERQPGTVPPANRKYALYKFICAVCGVETYRKRVRTLPFQEFPFLANQRPPGSLTLGNNPLAVVCLDCSETLWAQSAEYDRWGLPVHKRRFNWLARPPPDPDSLEATVARLPSGETQLPRCPPTEPVLKPRESVHFEPVPGQHKGKSRNSKSESNSGGSDNENPVRKTSLAMLDQSGVHPPVVTVAPMSSHSVSLTAHRKDSLSVPTNAPSGYGSTLPCVLPPIGHPIFPRPALFPPSSYGPYGWPAIDTSNDHYSYSSLDGLQSSSNASWSWLPPPQASSLIPYPSYLPTSYSGRSYSMSEPFYNSSHSYYPPSPEGNTSVSTVTSTSASYMAPVTAARPSSPRNLQHQKSGHAGATSLMRTLTPAVSTNDRDISPPPLISRKHTAPDLRMVAAKRPIQEIPLKKLIASKSGKSPPLEANPVRTSVPRKSLVIPNPEAAAAVKNTQLSTDIAEPPPPSTTFKPKSHAIRNHMNENLMMAKKWKKAALTETVIASRDSLNSIYSTVSSQDNYDDQRPPSKIFRRFSESEPVDFSFKERSLSTSSSSSLPSSYERCATADVMEDDPMLHRTNDDAMDLSVPSSQKVTATSNGTSNKFMIAYLCQKEKVEENLARETQRDNHGSAVEAIKNSNLSPAESSGRRSVIVTLPKPDLLETVDDAGRSEVISETSSIENNCIRVTENEAPVVKDALKPQDSEIMPTEDRNNDEVDATVHVGSRNSSQTSSVSNEFGDMTTETVNLSEAPDVNYTAEENPGNHDVTVMKEYVQKIVGDYKEEAEQAELMKKKLEADQEDFLGNFGLVTLQKKSEVELENLISRSKHHTLPPLKLRPSTPPKVQLEKEFANKLLEIAFDDPSLKKCDLNEDEVAFLIHLGLKPASKSEKEKRETRWKVALMERMMRAKRGESLIGNKKPWDSESSLSRLLSICETNVTEAKNFDALSVALPEEVGDKAQPNTEARPSDLLQITDTKSTDECGSSPTSNTNSPLPDTPLIQPVISYPKYIPSYAATQASALKKVGTGTELGNTADERASKSVHQSNLKAKPGGPDARFTNNNLLQVGDARILKVPVINPSGPLVDSSRVNVTDEETVNAESVQRKDGSVESRDNNCHSPACLDEIIRVDALNCENFVNQINNLLASMPASPTSRSEKMDCQANWPSSAAEWRKLKKYLKSRQSQIKIIEEKLKKREKKILSHLRACASNTH